MGQIYLKTLISCDIYQNKLMSKNATTLKCSEWIISDLKIICTAFELLFISVKALTAVIL